MFNYIQCLRAGDGVTNVLQLNRAPCRLPPGTPKRRSEWSAVLVGSRNSGVGLDASPTPQRRSWLGGHLANLADRLFLGSSESFTFNAAATTAVFSGDDG